MVEALVAEPKGDGERALAVMAEDNDGGVGIELGVGAGGDVAHGHEEGVGELGDGELPRLTDVEEDGGGGCGAELGEGLRGDFGVEEGGLGWGHINKDIGLSKDRVSEGMGVRFGRVDASNPMCLLWVSLRGRHELAWDGRVRGY